MKPFDFEKYADIDVVAWNCNGKCFGWSLTSLSSRWDHECEYLEEYDIDPATQGFDWTKSKQIRPTVSIHLLEMYQKKIAELKKENSESEYHAHVAELNGIINLLEKDLNRDADRIAELEKELHVWRSGKVYKNEQSTISRQLVNEKLIDFWAQRYKYNEQIVTPDELIGVCNIETDYFRQAIERIEKNDR